MNDDVDGDDLHSPLTQFREEMKAANEGGYCQFCRKPFKVTDAQRGAMHKYGLTHSMVDDICRIIEPTDEPAAK
jgi:hypothetical protein